MLPDEAHEVDERKAAPAPAVTAAPPRPRRSRAQATLQPTPRRSPQDVGIDLLQLVLTTPTIEAHLDELVALAAGVSPVIAGSGVTVRWGAQVLSITASNGLATELDEVQYGLEQGPCLSAMETARVMSIEDMGAEQRFGTYPARAGDRGVLSSFTVPLTVASTTIGALSSYSREAHSRTRVLRQELLGFAAQAEVALTLTLRAASQSDIAEQLQTAMHTRSLIDQALGFVMSEQRCNADQAFVTLRATSQLRNRTISEVATELITTTTGSEPCTRRTTI